MLCALAAGGHELRRVENANDDCVIEALVPSDIWSFAGILTVTLAAADGASVVTAATRIAGQMFDWGKSRRILKALFDEIERELKVSTFDRR